MYTLNISSWTLTVFEWALEAFTRYVQDVIGKAK